MRFIDWLIVIAVFGVALWLLGVVIWFFVSIFFGQGNGQNENLRRSTFSDADEDAVDPDWEDHIRHDPYHPGGSGGRF